MLYGVSSQSQTRWWWCTWCTSWRNDRLSLPSLTLMSWSPSRCCWPITASDDLPMTRFTSVWPTLGTTSAQNCQVTAPFHFQRFEDLLATVSVRNFMEKTGTVDWKGLHHTAVVRQVTMVTIEEVNFFPTECWKCVRLTNNDKGSVIKSSNQ